MNFYDLFLDYFAHLTWDKILEIFGFCIGLLYLWWEYHADSRLWFASIVMPTISMWIYFRKGLYADFGINIYYFVIAIYGYIAWTRARHRTGAPSSNSSGSNATERDPGKVSKNSLPITHISGGKLALCVLVFLILWIALYFILHCFTNSNVPIPDAFTTALSIVAMWMLARKYIEQWIAWIIVDAVCVGLYEYKGIYFYAVLYAIYTVVAAIGYRNWQKIMKKEKSTSTTQ